MPAESNHHPKQSIIDEFDKVAPTYETNRLSPWYKAHADIILETMSSAPSGNMLDIGCGTGYLLRNYAKLKPDARSFGIDIAPNMIKVAQEAASDAKLNQIDFTQGDWETIDTLSSGRSNLSTIVCANTFHYFSDPQAAITKMANLLDFGGQLVILERDKTRSLLTLVWDILHRTIIKDHVVFYDKNTLIQMLERAGFENIKIARHIKRYFWKGKLFTNIILISCQKSQ